MEKFVKLGLGLAVVAMLAASACTVSVTVNSSTAAAASSTATVASSVAAASSVAVASSVAPSSAASSVAPSSAASSVAPSSAASSVAPSSAASSVAPSSAASSDAGSSAASSDAGSSAASSDAGSSAASSDAGSSAASSDAGSSAAASSVGIMVVPSVSVGANEILVAFDLDNTAYPPTTWGVVPFIVGTMAAFTTGGGDWGAATNGGIASDGTGPQTLTHADGLWYVKLTMPDSAAYNIQFKAANYATAGWANVVSDFWGATGIGTANTGVNNDQINVSNGMVVSAVAPNNTTVTLAGQANIASGIGIDVDYQRVYVDVTAQGGWGVQVVGNTTADFNLTLIFTNIPVSRTGTALLDSVWLPLEGVVSNTNDFSTIAATATVTGNQGYLHTDGVTAWDPTLGNAVTVDAGTATGVVTVVVPAGSPRSVQYKMANILGWDRGEQPNNVSLPLPLSGDMTNTVNYIN